jgi:hypothetical protein
VKAGVVINRQQPSKGLVRRGRKAVSDPALRYAILLLVVMRVVISLWAALVLAITRAPTIPVNHRGHAARLHPATVRNGIWEALPNKAFLAAEKLPEHPITDGKRLTCASNAL